MTGRNVMVRSIALPKNFEYVGMCEVKFQKVGTCDDVEMPGFPVTCESLPKAREVRDNVLPWLQLARDAKLVITGLVKAGGREQERDIELAF